MAPFGGAFFMGSQGPPLTTLQRMHLELGLPITVINGGLALEETQVRPCHGFQNGCLCGCKPGKPRGSGWLRRRRAV
jgi:hypothetical protein